GRTASHEIYENAATALRTATTILRPSATANPPTNALTLAQRDYAQALAWRKLIDRRLELSDRRAFTPPTPQATDDDGPQTCRMRLTTEPQLNLPAGLDSSFDYGVVVVRMLLNEAGTVRDMRVAAALPQSLQGSVESVVTQWRTERAQNAARDCRMSPVIFVV